MYADAACTHQAKRKVSHALQDYEPVGRCTAQHSGTNGNEAFAYTYCHN
jgi:hypothetical protein